MIDAVTDADAAQAWATDEKAVLKALKDCGVVSAVEIATLSISELQGMNPHVALSEEALETIKDFILVSAPTGAVLAAAGALAAADQQMLPNAEQGLAEGAAIVQAIDDILQEQPDDGVDDEAPDPAASLKNLKRLLLTEASATVYMLAFARFASWCRKTSLDDTLSEPKIKQPVAHEVDEQGSKQGPQTASALRFWMRMRDDEVSDADFAKDDPIEGASEAGGTSWGRAAEGLGGSGKHAQALPGLGDVRGVLAVGDAGGVVVAERKVREHRRTEVGRHVP